MGNTVPGSDFQDLVHTTSVLEIVGDMIRVRTDRAALGELAIVENVDGVNATARVVGVDGDIASLQVFTGGKGLSTRARVRFTGLPLQVTYSENILGRIFNGAGEPIDGRPQLNHDARINVGGPTVNPTMRVLASNLIETEVPMIDLFNCLVESQKIPIF